jgi:hypothetical protein
MDHDYIKYLQENNPTVRLFRLDHAPLIISFLFLYFKKQNRQNIQSTELTTCLSDYLFSLMESHGKNIYAGTPQYYLDKWVNEGFLRKFYQAGSDEPVFELTPASEKAFDLLRELDRREFIGTESRLLKIFEILSDIVYKTSVDPATRLFELERQKEALEREIEETRRGNLATMTATQVRERYFDLEDTARKLLSDFRQIEYNFRDLDRMAREKQITGDLRKGRLLGEIFNVHDLIWDTDQGRSFRAFWEFLMSQRKQDELDMLIEAVTNLPEIREESDNDFLERLKTNLVDAGDRVNRTTHNLIEHLRRFLDDRAMLENRRIIEIIGEIKKLSVEVKDNPPKDRDFLVLDDRPGIDWVLERPLYSPPKKVELSDLSYEYGESDADTDALFRAVYIDQEELRNRIGVLLRTNSQVTLKYVTEHYPIERGLAELLAYMDIASKDGKVVVNNDITEVINIFNKETGRRFEMTSPRVIFVR